MKKFVLLGIISLVSITLLVSYFDESFASITDPRTECGEGQVLAQRIAHNDYVCLDSDTAQRWETIGIARIVDPTHLERTCFQRQIALRNLNTGIVSCFDAYKAKSLLTKGWTHAIGEKVLRQRPDKIETETTALPDTRLREKECKTGNILLENPSNGYVFCSKRSSVPNFLALGWITTDTVPTSETEYYLPHLTECQEGDAELKHSSTGHVICINQDKVDNLISEGWALFTPPELPDVESQKIEDIDDEQPAEPPTATNLEIIETDEQDVYRVIFQECASGDDIRDPIIQISSDTQQLTVQMIETLHRNDCRWVARDIRASDPSTIQISTVDFIDDDNVEALEEKIASLEQKVDEESAKLGQVKKMRFISHQDYIDAVKEQSDKLQDTGRELKRVTAEYYEYMYRHHS